MSRKNSSSNGGRTSSSRRRFLRSATGAIGGTSLVYMGAGKVLAGDMITFRVNEDLDATDYVIWVNESGVEGTSFNESSDDITNYRYEARIDGTLHGDDDESDAYQMPATAEITSVEVVPGTYWGSDFQIYVTETNYSSYSSEVSVSLDGGSDDATYEWQATDSVSCINKCELDDGADNGNQASGYLAPGGEDVWSMDGAIAEDYAGYDYGWQAFVPQEGQSLQWYRY